MEKLILVLYIDIGNMDNDAVECAQYVQRVGKTLFSEEVVRKLEATTFVIPVRGGGTRIECINPKFVVDTDVYKEYKLKLDILNDGINHFIRNNNDEQK